MQDLSAVTATEHFFFFLGRWDFVGYFLENNDKKIAQNTDSSQYFQKTATDHSSGLWMLFFSTVRNDITAPDSVILALNLFSRCDVLISSSVSSTQLVESFNPNRNESSESHSPRTNTWLVKATCNSQLTACFPDPEPRPLRHPRLRSRSPNSLESRPDPRPRIPNR